jgi:hypothetical protein
MVTERRLDLKTVIDFLKDKDSRTMDWEGEEIDGELIRTRFDFRCQLQYQKVKPYEVDASEFLSFAKEDLRGNSERGRVNALSNAKRAIECRMDEFLTLSNFRFFSSHHGWKLPYKMQVLQTFGVPAPNILRSLITSKRNLLEHEYMRPKDQQEIQNIVDITELFLKATDPYVGKGYLASATVSRAQWFKPGFFAPTLFGKSMDFRESTSKKVEYHDGVKHKYELKFDLEREALTLVYSHWEVYRRLDLKAGKVEERSGGILETKEPITIPIRDCKMEEVRELMVLLREKADEGL